MEIKKIIWELKYYHGYFPEEALKAAIEQKEEIIPELLQMLKISIENINYVSSGSSYMGHLYAIYLLAQFRVPDAFPLIVEFFTYFEEDDYSFMGDFITEDLHRILASVFNGDIETLEMVSTYSACDEFTRIAFLDACLILFKEGQIDRTRLLDIFRGVFRKQEREESYIWQRLVEYCVIISAEELLDFIIEAYNDDLIDNIELPQEDAISDIKAKNISYSSYINMNLIENAVDETQWLVITMPPIEEPEYFKGMSDLNKEIFKELEYFNGYYPEEALKKAIANKNNIIPDLLKILNWVTEHPELMENIDYICPVYACFLLGIFEEKSAFPIIIKFIGSVNHFSESFQEFVFCNLSVILASCYSGDNYITDQYILNQKLREEIRSAIMDCYLVLYKNNKISRKTFLEILRYIFAHIERDPSLLWDSMFDACILAHATEFIKEIENAYKQNLVNTLFYPRQIILRYINDSEDCSYNFERLKKLESEIKETDWWKFIELTEPEEIKLTYFDRISAEQEDFEQSQRDYCEEIRYNNEPVKPYVRTGEKIGRNDPCPCGSGKKYKKCCGKNI
ncbi:MAG: DUF1186 domain-containing protein [Candidatus Cloacimonetes bacterium]|nr:DUF1186 domain-containing protein [Candidatus Cloacimonadota bacterium]